MRGRRLQDRTTWPLQEGKRKIPVCLQISTQTCFPLLLSKVVDTHKLINTILQALSWDPVPKITGCSRSILEIKEKVIKFSGDGVIRRWM